MNEIETARLTGRPVTHAHAAHLERLFGDVEIRRWTSPAGSGWSADGAGQMAIRLSAHWEAHGWGQRLWFQGTRLVGIAGLQFAIISGLGTVELSFAVLAPERRRGYAREALTAILADASQISDEIRAAVLSDNRASLQLLGALGFTPAGSARDGPRDLSLLSYRSR